MLFQGNPNARVRDGEVERDPVRKRFLHPDVDNHLAALGELDGVAHEVQQHLPQTTRVAEQHARDVGLHAAAELEALFVSAPCEQLDSILDDLACVERDTLERQLPGFYS